MATSRSRKPAATKRPRPPRRPRVRMYRHGFGDCFLISLPRGRGEAHIMIDCGVLLGTRDAAATVQAVVADIARVTGGEIALLAVTHEHWDHVSGFLQAGEGMRALRTRQVWMSWAENPDDPQARRLAGERARALAALRLGMARLGLAGADGEGPLAGLLGFFGAGGSSTRDALEAARALAPGGRPRYLEPGEGPLEIEGTGARIYILGPPRDEALLLRSQPSRAGRETYEIAPGLPLDDAAACLAGAAEAPFAARWAIPLEVAATLPFFRRVLVSPEERWRGISGAWLDGLAELALKLDAHTNNTSLVLAIELPSGAVLLFAGDAQVGNWLSWQGLRWQVAGGEVTGPDLLARTVLYKVGHHGSHNATLREQGLETMGRLATALVPVDEAIARRQNWTRIPLPSLMTRLAERTGGRVLRADAGRDGVPPVPAARDIRAADLWFEVRL
ncbi:hypothetical protein FK498_12850 [Elioraea sp. Yellowstone]|jgi:hypothetical protein|uniref:MBL fold metallo-hydrolase n=1 Tax=Elioraea sp. Yellowstone TaxID=2592070 RepID=UPI00114E94E7|nr:MBL fold metallo-hydrolase [Elioraea sp. Yellowstone]TQF77377.1 hypothetical protein FK498_12850 [Elioraea sp. Yellowstone]